MLQIQEFLSRQKQKAQEKTFLRRIHHELMKAYGWIPFEEFKKLPMTMVMGLLEEIKQDKKKPDYTPVVIMGYSKKAFKRRR